MFNEERRVDRRSDCWGLTSYNIIVTLLYSGYAFFTILFSHVNHASGRRTNDFLYDIATITVRLTCNGRKTDSIVAALGWSGAGATMPPRPLSTPPVNVSCDPGNKTITSRKMTTKNNRNIHTMLVWIRDAGMWLRRRIYTNPGSVSGVSCTAKKTAQICPVFAVLGTRDSARSSR